MDYISCKPWASRSFCSSLFTSPLLVVPRPPGTAMKATASCAVGRRGHKQECAHLRQERERSPASPEKQASGSSSGGAGIGSSSSTSNSGGGGGGSRAVLAREHLMGLRVSELKALLLERGQSLQGALVKSDLVARVLEGQNK